jgi:hypothetical protein
MTGQQPTESPTINKLLIEFIFKKPKIHILKSKYCIQNKPYRFGLKIKNIDEKYSSEALVKNLFLSSGEGGTLIQDHTEEFCIPKLNPSEEIKIWWPNPTVTIIKGSVWIQCKITPKESNVIVKTYQVDRCTNKPQNYRIPNSWGDAIVIRGELEEKQSKTNFLLLILTILMFLDGVWGLDVLYKITVINIGWFFSTFGNWLSQIAQK